MGDFYENIKSRVQSLKSKGLAAGRALENSRLTKFLFFFVRKPGIIFVQNCVVAGYVQHPPCHVDA